MLYAMMLAYEGETDPEKHFDAVIESAKKGLEEEGKQGAIYIHYQRPEGIWLAEEIPAPRNVEEKERYRQECALKTFSLPAQALIVVAESWMADPQTPEQIAEVTAIYQAGGTIKNLPYRKHCLSVELLRPDNPPKVKMLPFRLEDDKVIWEEPSENFKRVMEEGSFKSAWDPWTNYKPAEPPKKKGRHSVN